MCPLSKKTESNFINKITQEEHFMIIPFKVWVGYRVPYVMMCTFILMDKKVGGGVCARVFVWLSWRDNVGTEL